MRKSIQTLAALGLLTALISPMRAWAMDEEVDQDKDMKIRLEALEEEVKGLRGETFELNNLKTEGFVDMRYDDVRVPANNAGLSGIYIRRAEFKMFGYLGTRMIYSLGFDFTELKHKDVGLEILDVPFLPFVDLPDYAWTIRVGQYRMPFGISPQTSSSGIMMSERPLWNGGGTSMVGQPGRIVGERVMGVQLRQKVKYDGVLSYDLQGGGFNNATDDQTAGVNKMQVASAPKNITNASSITPAFYDNFKAQTTDQDLSWIGRFAISWDFVQAFLPEKSKIQTGVSYIYDGKNTVWSAGKLSNTVRADEVVGAELMVQLSPQFISTTEWVAANRGFGLYVDPTHTEGWSTDLALDFLPWIQSSVEKGDKMELLFRLEEETEYPAWNKVVNKVWVGSSANRFSRIGGGFKWSYLGGKNHTSFNYYVDAPEQMFGGDNRGASYNAPVTTFILQQQFAFETGKPKPRVTEE